MTPEERNEEAQRVVIRDKRRIDPETGAARTPAEQVWTPPGAVPEDPGALAPGPDPDGGPATGDAVTGDAATGDAATWRASQAPPAGGEQVAELAARVAELTNDLQRVTAEYANYRKRVDRDRALVADVATGSVLAALLPVLDDLDRAREHGDLTGAFKAVADQLEGVLGKLGLTPVGEPGDRFDPTLHEAVSHQTSADVTEPSCVAIFRRGYAHKDRLLRPALVAVADPAEPDAGGPGPAAAPPEAAGPESTGPESAGPHSSGPHSSGPEATGPAADAPGEQR